MHERKRTQRERIHIATVLLAELEASVGSGENIGVERLAELRATLRILRDEPEETHPYQERLYLVPVLSFSQSLNSLELPQVSVQLLRDAFKEFAFNRTPVDEYVRDRYVWMTPEQRSEKQQEVFYRVQLAKDLSVEACDIGAFDPRASHSQPPGG